GSGDSLALTEEQQQQHHRAGVVNVEYLRNVLFRFFNDKERRAQLVPVLSMLLECKTEEIKGIQDCTMSEKQEKERDDVLFRAVPLGSVTQCRVERVRAHGSRGATEFIDLYTDQIQDQQQQQQQHVLRARRGSRIGRGSSSFSPFARHVYDIVETASNGSCSPAAAIGRVVSNAAGSEFSVSEQRSSNSSSPGRPDGPWTEVCAAVYQPGAANACAGRGAPRSTTVVIRPVDASGCAVANTPSGTGSLVSRYRSAADADADAGADVLASVVVLLNKKPQWDAGIGAYTLDFGGRVTLASSKNLQLVCADSDSYVA
ncbi:Tubby- protein 2, partial [Coemansia sp. RSA 1285]